MWFTINMPALHWRTVIISLEATLEQIAQDKSVMAQMTREEINTTLEELRAQLGANFVWPK